MNKRAEIRERERKSSLRDFRGEWKLPYKLVNFAEGFNIGNVTSI